MLNKLGRPEHISQSYVNEYSRELSNIYEGINSITRQAYILKNLKNKQKYAIRKANKAIRDIEGEYLIIQ